MTQRIPSTPIPLSSASLAEITAQGLIQVPQYDRQQVRAGIVHFGLGNFHRAHQAMVMDELLSAGHQDWGICGVGVLESDRRMKQVMEAQDCLYTLVLKHSDGRREARVIGSIVEYMLAVDDPEAVLRKLSSPEIRIVSLTITEGGYNFDHVTGEFDASQVDVERDLQNTGAPATVFGLIVEALVRRRAAGIVPFTVMSCDNIQGNGDVAKRMFTAFARLRSPALADWIESIVAFPNTMVDRITPVTTDDDRADVATRLHVQDQWPVMAEPFFQWVVEDHFPAGRPPFENADVQLVDDVAPYELMKLRLLNASHQGLCYFGYLSGYRFAHEATQDPAIAAFLRGYMDEEATPTLLPVPGIDLDQYKSTLIERFSNPEIRDSLARLCAESSDRIPKWLLPVVRAQLAEGRSIQRSAAVVASWARYAEGIDESGEPIAVVDRLSTRLVPLAQSQRTHRTAFIEEEDVFGDLGRQPVFVAAYLDALDSITSVGAHSTVVKYSTL